MIIAPNQHLQYPLIPKNPAFGPCAFHMQCLSTKRNRPLCVSVCECHIMCVCVCTCTFMHSYERWVAIAARPPSNPTSVHNAPLRERTSQAANGSIRVTQPLPVYANTSIFPWADLSMYSKSCSASGVHFVCVHCDRARARCPELLV